MPRSPRAAREFDLEAGTDRALLLLDAFRPLDPTSRSTSPPHPRSSGRRRATLLRMAACDPRPAPRALVLRLRRRRPRADHRVPAGGLLGRLLPWIEPREPARRHRDPLRAPWPQRLHPPRGGDGAPRSRERRARRQRRHAHLRQHHGRPLELRGELRRPAHDPRTPHQSAARREHCIGPGPRRVRRPHAAAGSGVERAFVGTSFAGDAARAAPHFADRGRDRERCYLHVPFRLRLVLEPGNVGELEHHPQRPDPPTVRKRPVRPPCCR